VVVGVRVVGTRIVGRGGRVVGGWVGAVLAAVVVIDGVVVTVPVVVGDTFDLVLGVSVAVRMRVPRVGLERGAGGDVFGVVNAGHDGSSWLV
jgi:hypothetical protein